MPGQNEETLKISFDLTDASRGLDRIGNDAREADQALEKMVRSADRAGDAIRAAGNEDIKPQVDDSEVVSVGRRLADLGETITTRLDIQGSGLQETAGILADIAKPIAIPIAIIGGAALGALAIGVQNIIDIDNVMGEIEARTGRMIPDAEKLINDIWVRGWGESRKEVADVLTLAAQLDIPIADMGNATERALQVASVTGGEAQQILTTMDSLLSTGLVRSYSEAADVLVVGYQHAIDRGGDFQDTLREFSPAFAAARISGQGLMSFLSTGLDAGVESTAKLGEGFNAIRENVGKIGTDEGITAAFNRLDELSSIDLAGQLDLYRQGKISGDQFYDSLFAALREAPTDADTQAVLNTFFGPLANDYGLTVVAQLDPVTQEFTNMAGATQVASEAIQDNLGTKLEETWRTLQQEAADVLSSEALNLDEKLDDAKRRIGLFAQEIQEGNTLGGALEVALEIPGLEAQIEKLEGALGNFAIAMLEGIAGVLEVINQPEAAANLRGGITDLAEGQLAFDLKLADNGEAVSAAVQTAIERGVDQAAIQEALNVAVNEELQSGDIAGAQAIIDTVSSAGTAAASEMMRAIVNEAQNNPDLRNAITEVLGIDRIGEATAEQILGAYEEIQARIGEIDPLLGGADQARLAEIVEPAKAAIATDLLNTEGLQTQVDSYIDTLYQQFNAAVESGNLDLAALIAEQIGDEGLAEAVRAAMTSDEGVVGIFRTGWDDVVTGAEDAAGDLDTQTTDMASSLRTLSDATFEAVHGSSIVPDLLAIAETVNTSLPPLEEVFQNIAGEIGDMAGEFEVGALRVESGSEGFLIAAGRANVLADAIVTGLGNALPVLDAVISKLGQIASGASTANAIVDQVEANAAASAAVVDAGGEAGTTASIFAALAALSFGGGGSDMSNSHNRTNNVNMTVHTRSLAESDNAVQRVANVVRGF